MQGKLAKETDIFDESELKWMVFAVIMIIFVILNGYVKVFVTSNVLLKH